MPEDAPKTILECFEQGLKISGKDGVIAGIPQIWFDIPALLYPFNTF